MHCIARDVLSLVEAVAEPPSGDVKDAVNSRICPALSLS